MGDDYSHSKKRLDLGGVCEAFSPLIKPVLGYRAFGVEAILLNQMESDRIESDRIK